MPFHTLQLVCLFWPLTPNIDSCPSLGVYDLFGTILREPMRWSWYCENPPYISSLWNSPAAHLAATNYHTCFDSLPCNWLINFNSIKLGGRWVFSSFFRELHQLLLLQKVSEIWNDELAKPIKADNLRKTNDSVVLSRLIARKVCSLMIQFNWKI